MIQSGIDKSDIRIRKATIFVRKLAHASAVDGALVVLSTSSPSTSSPSAGSEDSQTSSLSVSDAIMSPGHQAIVDQDVNGEPESTSSQN